MDKKEKGASSHGDFDFGAFEKEAARQLKAGKSLSGKDGVLTPLIKRIIEQALKGELDTHLVAARLRHIAGSRWGLKQYLKIERIGEMMKEQVA